MSDLLKHFEKLATTVELGVDNGFDRVTFDKTKFAELIIKECLGIAEDVTTNTENSDAERMGAEYVITNIIERFGVK